MTVYDFLAEHGRLPRAGDTPPPWRYHGWLLLYVQGIHAQGHCGDRWGYYLRTLAAGKLLDEPIPQIEFGAPDPRVEGQLHEWARLVGQDLGGWSDFRVLLEWLAWGLGVSQEETKLADAVQERLYRAVNVGPLLAAPYDYLGRHVEEWKAKGWNPSGFYPTPHEVVKLMVAMTMHDAAQEGRDGRTLSVCDPCVGSGRMLLEASNYSLRLYGQDIDPLAVLMCLINGALYAPWMVFPLPAAVLGVEEPPPPAALPEPAPAPEGVVRVDRSGQGWLF
jgi:hypothetical protein